MRLPNAELALVEQEKITEYLLNPEHPDNGGKAAYFLALGFGGDDWDIFADALRHLALLADVTESMETMHGKKYIVDRELQNPAAHLVRTIWIIDTGMYFPRLVTAYPFGK
jgi:hypothetical protein